MTSGGRVPRRTATLGLGVAALLLALNWFQPPGISGGPASTIAGDADCSGTVNPVDSLVILRQDAGMASAPCVDLADVQCDEDVDPIDALRILRFDAGLPLSTPDGCTPIGESVTPDEPPATSEDLIAGALAAGEISYETSLIYRAYALYADDRLPADYRSPVINLDSGTALATEIATSRDTLSAATLAEVTPFITRPNDPASVFSEALGASQQSGADAERWRSEPAAGSALRVWIHGTEAEADVVLSAYALVVEAVRPKLQALIADPILDHAGAPNIDVNPDSAIDIYFIDVGAVDPRIASCRANPNQDKCAFDNAGGGYTWPELPFSGNKSSAAVLIDIGVEGDELYSHVAHELFHVAQFGYDYQESDWLMDATATWAAFRVLQELGKGRDPVFDYLFELAIELQFPLDSNRGHTRYGSFLYFVFTQMENGDNFVRSVWAKAGAPGKQGTQAVDDLFPFREHFHDFALRNWNAEPIPEPYSQADATFPGADVFSPDVFESEVTLQSPQTFLDVNIQELATHYFRFRPVADNVGSVVFHNPLAGLPNADVQALIKIGDDWRPPEDWSGQSEVEFCRDRPDEEITELVVIISNSDLEQPLNPPENPRLEALIGGCQLWAGEIFSEWSTESSAENTHGSLSVLVTFEEMPDAPGCCSGASSTIYKPVAGTVQWSINGTVLGGCTIEGSGTYSVLEGDFSSPDFYSWPAHLAIWDDAQNRSNRYHGYGHKPDLPPPATLACPDIDPIEYAAVDASEWLRMGTNPLDDDGPRINEVGNIGGTHTTTDDSGTRTQSWQWTLAPVPDN